MPDECTATGVTRTFSNPMRYWDLPDGRKVKVTPEEYDRLKGEVEKGKDAAPK